MAGQSIERREILRILTLAAGAATFPGFSKWSFACGHISKALAQIKPAVYQPLFFTAPEYVTFPTTHLSAIERVHGRIGV